MDTSMYHHKIYRHWHIIDTRPRITIAFVIDANGDGTFLLSRGTRRRGASVGWGEWQQGGVVNTCRCADSVNTRPWVCAAIQVPAWWVGTFPKGGAGWSKGFVRACRGGTRWHRSQAWYRLWQSFGRGGRSKRRRGSRSTGDWRSHSCCHGVGRSWASLEGGRLGCERRGCGACRISGYVRESCRHQSGYRTRPKSCGSGLILARKGRK